MFDLICLLFYKNDCIEGFDYTKICLKVDLKDKFAILCDILIKIFIQKLILSLLGIICMIIKERSKF